MRVWVLIGPDRILRKEFQMSLSDGNGFNYSFMDNRLKLIAFHITAV